MMLIPVASLAFVEIESTTHTPSGFSGNNMRDDAMIEVNKTQPLFGERSLMFDSDNVTNGQDKADLECL